MMDPNFEGPKIPLMTLAGITSLTDVLHELPLPGPHPDILECPLFAYAAVPMPGVRRLANSANPNNILNIVEALSRVSTDEIVLKNLSQDTDCLEGLNVPPLLQAVLANKPDIFYRKKSTTEVGGNITGKHHSPVQAATPQSPAIGHKGLPMYQRSPAECAASETSLHNIHDGHHVQAPPNEQVNRLAQHQVIDSVGAQSQTFRRKPKTGKVQSQDSRSSEENQSNVQYDIISGPVEQSHNSSTRSLKLKLTRIKHEPGVSQPQPSTERVEMSSHEAGHHHTTDFHTGFNPGTSDLSYGDVLQNPMVSATSNSGNSGNTNSERANGFSRTVPGGSTASHVPTEIPKPAVSSINQSQIYQDYAHTPPVVESQTFSTGSMNVIDHSVSFGGGSLDTPRRKYSGKGSSGSKSKKKNLQHIRVKFIADQEEADIYKLSDILYMDDSEVSSFNELKSGMMVVAKWPQNGKMYEALVIDPLENTGRKARERKQVKPFQINPGSRELTSSTNDGRGSPRVVLEDLSFLTNTDVKSVKFSDHTQFTAYNSMADRIKLKRKRLSDKGSGKKQRLNDSNRSIITMSSDEDDEEDKSFHREKSSKHSKKKLERRRKAEMRMMQEGGTATGSLKRFNAVVELIFEDMETVDKEVFRIGPGDPIPKCLLIPASRLRELNSESAKLKSMGILSQVPVKFLVNLLKYLEPNIRSAVKINPLVAKGDLTPQEQKWKQEQSMEKVHAATDAAITALNVMTSPGMPKAVFIEDAMESAIQLLRFQLSNTIYPEYDTVYKTVSRSKTSKESHFASIKQKRAHYKGTKSRAVAYLYNKMINLMMLWVELLEIQPLTDTSVLQVSSVAISPFFVENVRELQLSAIRLTTTVFAQYEQHRKIILEDIFQSFARLPTSKRNLRSFKLSYADGYLSDDEESSEQIAPYIQMVSALVLQMIQAIVNLHLATPTGQKEVVQKPKLDDMRVIQSYDNAMRIGQSFLAVFLKKPLFENFIHDLLATVNKPEWPASEMMLSVLGRLLVRTFMNKQTEASLRVASIDYLGIIAAKLRRDTVSSNLDKNIIKKLVANLEKNVRGEDDEETTNDDDVKKEIEEETVKVEDGGSTDEEKEKEKRKTNKDGKKEDSILNEDQQLEHHLHSIVLGYIRSNAETDPALTFAHNFYIGQWLRDIVRKSADLKQDSKSDDEDAIGRILQENEVRKNKILELANESVDRRFLLNKRENTEATSALMTPMKKKMESLCSQLTYEDATLMTKYLASNRPFSQAFDTYLTHILLIREESSVAVRTKAIKCLTEVVSVDPGILSRNDIWHGVQVSLLDASTSVREAAVDLIGRFILLKPELVSRYYKMLSARILDTGVSVRKRVIRILRDLCHEHPDLPQLTDACVKMIRRVNDEEGIKKLVHEVFMKMWFTPMKRNDARSMRLKALSVADIVAANGETGYEWIEQMMFDLAAEENENKSIDLACQQIVNCLIDHLLQIEQENDGNPDPLQSEKDSSDEPASVKDAVIADAMKGRKREEMISATMKTLVLFAKIRPKLLMPHIMTLQPYLATKCETNDDLQILQSVCSILDMAVPHLEHPGEDFLALLEENLMRLILREKFVVVKSAIACLGSVTKHITHNYKLVWECFQKLGVYLHGMRSLHQKFGFSQAFNAKLSQLLRTLYITGNLMKTFDFDDEQFKGSSQICVKDRVYDCILYFTQLNGNRELQGYAVGALGLLMIQDPNMMFRTETKQCYDKLLSVANSVDSLKNQVLLNLQTYLSNEDVRMQEAAKASTKKSEDPSTLSQRARKQLEIQQQQQEESEDIKEICDVSSGMASSVMQVYLKQVLDCFFHRHSGVRHSALNAIFLTLTQGLVHPIQCMPYIVAMSTDPDPLVFNKSEQLLNEVGKRYSSFIHSTSLSGIKMAFKLQQAISSSSSLSVTRGVKVLQNSDEGGPRNKACCAHLYSLIRGDRKHRRAIIQGLLNLFDDTMKSELDLLLFVADNLAHFPYSTQDEPLYIISQIEVYVSVSGSNVLQSFKECLQQTKSKKPKKPTKPPLSDEARSPKLSASDSDSESKDSSSNGSDIDISDTEEEDGIFSRLPDHDAPLVEFLESSMACLLLLKVKLHLKAVFGFTDNKIHRYSPNESVKANDNKVLRKRADLLFDPVNISEYLTKKVQGAIAQHPAKDKEFKMMVVKQYFEFNELMNKLDPNDEDSDSEKDTPHKRASKPAKEPLKIQTNEGECPDNNQSDDQDSDRDSDMEMPKSRTALDIIRQSGVNKHKKKLLKSRKDDYDSRPESPVIPKELRTRRKEVKYVESSGSDDSGGEFLGF